MTPPPKAVLIDKIDIACCARMNAGEDTRALEALLLKLVKKSADSAWLVQVLHLVDSSDEIFARDYVYVRPTKIKAIAQMPLVSNADGFFDNLPAIKSKGKRIKQQLRLTKAQKDAMQLQVYEQRQAELA